MYVHNDRRRNPQHMTMTRVDFRPGWRCRGKSAHILRYGTLTPCTIAVRLLPVLGCVLMQITAGQAAPSSEGDICLTVEPPYMGGLSNTFAFINAAITFAVSRPGLRVVTPHLLITGHHVSRPQEDFADLMTGALPALRKSLRKMATADAPTLWTDITCRFDEVPGEVLDQYRDEWNSHFKRKSRRCPIERLTWQHAHHVGLLSDDTFMSEAEAMKGHPFMAPDSSSGLANYNGCALVVLVDGESVHYHHDYRFSNSIIYQQYHLKYPEGLPPAASSGVLVGTAATHAGSRHSPSLPQLVASFHFRLGDVYDSVAKEKDHGHDDGGRWVEKLMSPAWIPFGLFLLQAALPDFSCVAFHLFTDVPETHEAIQEIEQNLRTHGLPLPIVHGDEVPARIAFDAMAWSDVLVVGTSGFGRVAAVVNTGVSFGPNANGHPLTAIPGVIEIEDIEQKVLWNAEGIATFEEAKALALSTSDRHVERARDRLRRELQDFVTTKRPELSAVCGFSSNHEPGPPAHSFEQQWQQPQVIENVVRVTPSTIRPLQRDMEGQLKAEVEDDGDGEISSTFSTTTSTMAIPGQLGILSQHSIPREILNLQQENHSWTVYVLAILAGLIMGLLASRRMGAW